jgi:hypothetical protein
MNNYNLPEGNSDDEADNENYDSENIIDDNDSIINPNLAAISQEYIQFETSSGNWALNHNGYNYIVKRTSNRKITWKCMNNGCTTTLFCQYDVNLDGSPVMRDENEGIVNFYSFHFSTSSRIQNPGHHKHLPDPYYLIHKLARAEITRLVITGTYSFMGAYNHVLSTGPNAMVMEARATFSNKATIRRAVNRAQQRNNPPNPSNAVELKQSK